MTYQSIKFATLLNIQKYDIQNRNEKMLQLRQGVHPHYRRFYSEDDPGLLSLMWK